MKKNVDVARAWRDEEYRNSLTAEELASLPENPAGMATVDDSALRSVAGGVTRFTCDGTHFADSCVTYPQQCP
jgi:mersacidin/lichenicidin family type 2 lantibiotic